MFCNNGCNNNQGFWIVIVIAIIFFWVTCSGGYGNNCGCGNNCGDNCCC